MRGVVSCVKHGGSPEENVYSVVDADSGSCRTFKSTIVLKEGELAEFEPEDGIIRTAAISFDEKIAKGVVDGAGASAKRHVKNKPYKHGQKGLDDATTKMWPKLSAAARLFIRKLLLGVPIMIRFHNDADGSSGAYAVYKALEELGAKTGIGAAGNISWKMHRSVAYASDDASGDYMLSNGYASIEKPLLLIIDFGTSVESNSGIDVVSKRFDIIWLDHHPLEKGFGGFSLEHYINPWQYGGDSNYTAGFLACTFARTFSGVDVSDLAEASFIGDYSEYSRPTESGRKLSMLLDLLTSDTSIVTGARDSNLSPEGINSVVIDGKRTEELLDYAKNKLDEAIAAALRSVKMQKAGSARIFIVDFKDVRDDTSRYPLPGRFASKLLDKVAELNPEPCVVVLHFNRFVSVRVDKKIADKTNLLGAIREMKDAYTNVDSGGGHMSAGTIKLSNDENRNEIIRHFVNTMKRNLEA